MSALIDIISANPLLAALAGLLAVVEVVILCGLHKVVKMIK